MLQLVDKQDGHPDAPSARGLDLATAATHLGTTPEGIRKRIARGTLKGEKINGRWTVHLDVHPDAMRTATRTVRTIAATTVRTERPDASNSQLTETLRSEISHLRTLIERQATEITEQRATISDLANRLAAIAERQAPARSRRWWWPF